jgi:hypothetical protein
MVFVSLWDQLQTATQKHAVQREIWEPPEIFHSTYVEMAGRSTFWIHTDFQPAVRHSNTGTLTVGGPSLCVPYL